MLEKGSDGGASGELHVAKAAQPARLPAPHLQVDLSGGRGQAARARAGGATAQRRRRPCAGLCCALVVALQQADLRANEEQLALLPQLLQELVHVDGCGAVHLQGQAGRQLAECSWQQVPAVSLLLPLLLDRHALHCSYQHPLQTYTRPTQLTL